MANIYALLNQREVKICALLTKREVKMVNIGQVFFFSRFYGPFLLGQ